MVLDRDYQSATNSSLNRNQAETQLDTFETLDEKGSAIPNEILKTSGSFPANI